MGLFLAASGVVGRDAAAVRNAIGAYVANVGGTFESRDGTTEDKNIGVMQEAAKLTTVLYPDGFSDFESLSQHLSTALETAVFSFHIHDGDLWMLIAFDNGREVAWFNPIPDYWGEVSTEERAKWSGDANVVASLVPGVSPSSISNYFRKLPSETEDEPAKAYDDDEFPIGSDWQLTDFMRRLGFVYPLDDKGVPTGETFFLKIRRRRPQSPQEGGQQPPTTSPAPVTKAASKPWWKFW